MESVLLRVAPETDSPPARALELTALLERELRQLPLDRVDRPDAGAPPPGAKGSALEWAQLLVGFSGGLPAIVAMVRAWVARNPRCSVTLESADGDKVTIVGTPDEAQRELVDRWLDRHTAAGDGR
jgi:hypothetical protein